MPSQLADKVRAKFPGEYDDLDDATLEAKVLAKYPEYKDLVTPPQEKYDPTHGVKDAMIGFAKGAAGTAIGLGKVVHAIPGVTKAVDAMYGQPGVSDRAFEQADKAITATNTAQKVGKGAEMVAESMIPITKGVQVAKAVIPSATRAGANFNAAAQAANHLPVDTNAVGQIALRIQELSVTGGKMPKVASDLLARLTGPASAKGSVTFKEARDFYSNVTRLSAKERKRIPAVVMREVHKFRQALGEALQNTANAAGKGPEYASAMKEYSRAARFERVGEGLAILGKKAAIGGALGAGGVAGAKAVGILD